MKKPLSLSALASLLGAAFFLPPFGGIEGGFCQPGSLDTTFSTDGILTTDIGSINDYGYSVAIQSDGKIVVAGYFNNGTNDDFAVVRYNTDGALDNTFSADGIETTNFLWVNNIKA